MFQLSHRDDQNLPPGCVEGDHGYLPPDCDSLWQYNPSYNAALAFALLFGITTLVHLFQAYQYKKGYCWVVIMASAWETAGYLFRAANTRKQQNKGEYFLWSLFVNLAPIWLNAFVYMVLGRLVWTFIPTHRIMKLPAPTLGAVFVLLDIVAFMTQLCASTMEMPSAYRARNYSDRIFPRPGWECSSSSSSYSSSAGSSSRSKLAALSVWGDQGGRRLGEAS
ncbi:hypothetical protein GGR56DRAFT_47456 [Xylariaceae sp. FL0804]|nr:hypothetical protein GGR56DRAFT_47456 [Xylariaceae sp. FL0804]